jgi:hypothetical protein
VRLAVDEESDCRVVGSLSVEDVCLALWRLRLSDVRERERIARVRRCEQAQHQPHEILLQRIDSHLARGFELGRVAWGRRGRRDRKLDEILAVEARRGGASLLRRNLILSNVFIGQLDGDLELDRHDIIAADLTRSTGCDEVLHRGNLLLAPERLTRGRQNRGWVFRRGLRRGERSYPEARHKSKMYSDTHHATP